MAVFDCSSDDVLFPPRGLDNVSTTVVAKLDVVGGVHGEGGDGWLVRDGNWSVRQRMRAIYK